MARAVAPVGFALDLQHEPVLTRAFRRMVRELAYDVCEISFTTYLFLAKAHGKPFTALPVFLMRDFHHRSIKVNVNAGDSTPKKISRVGSSASTGGYTVTTGVWARGILESEYGVNLDAVTWVISDDEHVAEYRLPSNVVRVSPGRNLSDMVAKGDLAGVIGVEVDHPDVVHLIPEAGDAGFEALRKRGHYPINHLIVVRDDVLQNYDNVAPILFDVFAEAKNRYVAKLRDGTIARPDANDLRYRRVIEITGADPLPYGIGPQSRDDR